MSLFNFVLFSVVCSVAVKGQSNNDDAFGATSRNVVRVTPSGVIRGIEFNVLPGRTGEAYRGIRYAESPTGELRFQPPKLINRYAKEVDAREEGPACPQPAITPGYFIDEDCLRLNVYTPVRNSTRLLPVIVFMHPGGFYSVSGRSDVSGPHYLLERDVVYVSINYRLGTLGFLATGDEHAPGNNGFKDQVAALKWIQRNIKAFGGDPNLVTLTGYSAGSLSIGLHMVSPMSKGLFHRAISMSASPVSQVVIGTHQRHLAERQARLLNCPTKTSKEIVDCLKTKPWKEFADSLDNMFEFGFDPVLLWNVVLELDFGQERFLTVQPVDAIRQGKMYTVPYITSQTKDEFFWKAYNIQNNSTRLATMNSEWEKIAPISFMLPEKNSAAAANRLKEKYLDGKPVGKDAKSGDGLGKLYSDAVIGFAVHRFANLMCRHSPHKLFHYEFAYVGTSSHYVDPVTKKPTGAAHHDDMIYLFTLPISFPRVKPNSPDEKIKNIMTALWYNFARYGDPNPRDDTPELTGLNWPVMTPNSRKYLRVDSTLKVEENLFEDRYSIWDELYPIQY